MICCIESCTTPLVIATGGQSVKQRQVQFTIPGKWKDSALSENALRQLARAMVGRPVKSQVHDTAVGRITRAQIVPEGILVTAVVNAAEWRYPHAR
jgi:hypothetical protein